MAGLAAPGLAFSTSDLTMRPRGPVPDSAAISIPLLAAMRRARGDGEIHAAAGCAWCGRSASAPRLWALPSSGLPLWGQPASALRLSPRRRYLSWRREYRRRRPSRLHPTTRRWARSLSPLRCLRAPEFFRCGLHRPLLEFHGGFVGFDLGENVVPDFNSDRLSSPVASAAELCPLPWWATAQASEYSVATGSPSFVALQL